MKLSRRAKRMKIHHARSKDRIATLNMVSLMDIFTILVFFLLVNTTSSEVLPSPKNVTLPDSISEKLPLRNLVVAVDGIHIRLQGKTVISVAEVLSTKGNIISPLYDALITSAIKVKNLTNNKGITIMGDKEVPYLLLKKIMLTCAKAEYANISFAVNQKLRASEI